MIFKRHAETKQAEKNKNKKHLSSAKLLALLLLGSRCQCLKCQSGGRAPHLPKDAEDAQTATTAAAAAAAPAPSAEPRPSPRVTSLRRREPSRPKQLQAGGGRSVVERADEPSSASASAGAGGRGPTRRRPRPGQPDRPSLHALPRAAHARRSPREKDACQQGPGTPPNPSALGSAPSPTAPPLSQATRGFLRQPADSQIPRELRLLRLSGCLLRSFVPQGLPRMVSPSSPRRPPAACTYGASQLQPPPVSREPQTRSAPLDWRRRTRCPSAGAADTEATSLDCKEQ